MEVNSIIQFISSVGFPIVMCIALLYYIYTTHTKLVDAIVQLTHTIDNNTKKLEELTEGLKND